MPFSSTKPRILPPCASDFAQTTKTSAKGEFEIQVFDPWGEHLRTIGRMLRTILGGDRRLAAVVLLTIALGMSSFVPVWLVPLYATGAGVPEAWIGPIWAVVCLTIPVAMEVLISRIFAAPFLNSLESCPKDPPGAMEIFKFNLPLSVGGYFLSASAVILAAFIARTPDPDRILPVYYLALGLANPVAYAATRIQTVVLAFPPQSARDRRTFRFCLGAGAVLGVLPLIFIFPGLAEFYFIKLQKLGAQDLSLVRLTAISLICFPFSVSIRAQSEGLAAWSGSVDPNARWEPFSENRRLWLPEAMAQPAFAELFGKPAVEWTQADVASARATWNGCIQKAKKARDRDQQKLLQDARRYLTGNLRGVARYQERRGQRVTRDQAVEARQARELAEREAAGMPPYSYQALLRAEAHRERDPVAFLEQSLHLAKGLMAAGIEIWGPVPAPMERRAGRYRAHLLIQADQRPRLQALLGRWVPLLATCQSAARVRWSIDVDPQEML